MRDVTPARQSDWSMGAYAGIGDILPCGWIFGRAGQIAKPMPSNSTRRLQRPSGLSGLLGILVRAVPPVLSLDERAAAGIWRQGLHHRAVNVDHDGDADANSSSRRPALFKIVYDPSGKIAQYPLKGMPTSFLIGRDGAVRFEHDGFSNEAQRISRPYQRADRREEVMRRTLIFLAVAGLSIRLRLFELGPRPWEKDLMARPEMQVSSYAVLNAAEDHIYFSREASSGGRGFAGGGCGCN